MKHVTELVGNNKDTVKLFIIGKKANEFFSKRGYTIIKSYTNLFSSLDINIVREVASLIVKGFLNKEYDSVEIVYNEFKSVMRQNVVTESFLPLAKPEIIKNQVSSNIDYIYEPSSAVILNELIPRQLNMQLWKSLLESNAAEQGARMTAMEMATKNARDLIQYLELIYNRARQESITKELLEIVAGAEALKEN
ncbi:ATP synthase F1 subunit gamma [bacterium]|nr:MAG: ATP synthase F1 subunit gamma [bacterium]